MTNNILKEKLNQLEEQVIQYNMSVSTGSVFTSHFAYAEIRYNDGENIEPVGVVGFKKLGEKPIVLFVRDNSKSWYKEAPLTRVQNHGEECSDLGSVFSEIQKEIENDLETRVSKTEEITLF